MVNKEKGSSINSVVGYLKKVPYIKKVDGFESEYYDSQYNDVPPDKNARFTFEVRKDQEPQLEELIKVILARSLTYKFDFLVKFSKDYYVRPESIELESNWKLKLVPFENMVNRQYPADCKINTSLRATAFLEKVLSDYIKSKNYKSNDKKVIPLIKKDD